MYRFSFALDVCGVALIAAGAFLWSTVAGLVVSGVGLMALSFMSERDR